MHIKYEEVLENVQEKSVKMVAGLTSSTNGDRCAELGLETLKSRKERQDMALVHKYRDMQNAEPVQDGSGKLWRKAKECRRLNKHHEPIRKDGY